jgi:hypothetical protein
VSRFLTAIKKKTAITNRRTRSPHPFNSHFNCCFGAVYSPADRESQQVNRPKVELVTSRHLLNKSCLGTVYSPADRESQQVNCVEESQQVNSAEVELVTSRHLLNKRLLRSSLFTS